MATPAASVKQPAVSQSDPFRFGWRYPRAIPPNGSLDHDRIPLTPDDVLHPQEDDQIPENTMQNRERDYISGALRLQLAERTDILVLSDCIVDWGVPGLGNHSPDVCVMEGVTNRERDWTTFHVVEERARPVLAIEIVSVHDNDPEIRYNDVRIKLLHYLQVGIPLYVIVDQEEEGGQRQLRGYRLDDHQYWPMKLDPQGRLLLESVGLLLGLRDNRVVCYDAATGEEIPDFTGMAQARQQAELARQQAELARQQAELARQQAELVREAETHARQQAELARESEAQARQQAELARKAETQARQSIETALAAALARIQELEAQAHKDTP